MLMRLLPLLSSGQASLNDGCLGPFGEVAADVDMDSEGAALVMASEGLRCRSRRPCSVTSAWTLVCMNPSLARVPFVCLFVCVQERVRVWKRNFEHGN